MTATRVSESVRVEGEGSGVAAHVGLHLLGKVADRFSVAERLSDAVPVPGRAPVHDRGRVLTQMALALAGGGECVSDIAVLRDQPELFGEVASDPTARRVFYGIDDEVLAALRQALARARTEAWAAGAGPDGDELVLDLDASLVEIHSENKEGAAAHFKGGFGYHPMFLFTDPGECLSACLRPGNAAANSGADQLEAVDDGIAALPEEWAAGHRPGDDESLVERRVVVRADSAGCVKEVLQGLIDRNLEFSVSCPTTMPENLVKTVSALHDDDTSWTPAITQDGEIDPHAQVQEIDVDLGERWPEGIRVIVRRERRHPGAQLRLWDHPDHRFCVFVTNSDGDPAELDRRHRAHARVEDWVKRLKDCGLTRMPFGDFSPNAAWTLVVALASNLSGWTQRLHFDGDLAKAAPKTLRWRILHAPARLVRRGGQWVVRILKTWPWHDQLLGAYARLAPT